MCNAFSSTLKQNVSILEEAGIIIDKHALI